MAGARGLSLALAITASSVGCAAPSRSSEAAPAMADSGGAGDEAEAEMGGDAPMAGAAMDGAAMDAMDEGPMDEEAMEMADQQSELLDSLDSALSLANCDDAFGHRDAICDLSERICDIADDHPRAAERCEDAEQRCRRARERVSGQCD